MMYGANMTHLSNHLNRFWKDESGATAIEYGLIAALIGVGIIGGMKTLAGDSSSMWGELQTKVSAEVN